MIHGSKQHQQTPACSSSDAERPSSRRVGSSCTSVFTSDCRHCVTQICYMRTFCTAASRWPHGGYDVEHKFLLSLHHILLVLALGSSVLQFKFVLSLPHDNFIFTRLVSGDGSFILHCSGGYNHLTNPVDRIITIRRYHRPTFTTAMGRLLLPADGTRSRTSQMHGKGARCRRTAPKRATAGVKKKAVAVHGIRSSDVIALVQTRSPHFPERNTLGNLSSC